MHLFRKVFETKLTYSVPPEVFKCISVDLEITYSMTLKNWKKTTQIQKAVSITAILLGFGGFWVY